MTKSELIDEIAERLRLPHGKAEQIVNTIFESMSESMIQGNGIEIRGFGSFTVRSYKAYEGRNPRTGQAVHVPPKRLPFFKVGKELRRRVDVGRMRVRPFTDYGISPPSPQPYAEAHSAGSAMAQS